MIERHNTHTLSSHNSSSKNYSYDSEIFNKKMNNITQRENKGKSINSHLTKLQLSKINEILSKYNLASDRSKKEKINNNKKLENNYVERKSLSKQAKSIYTMNSEVQSMRRKKKKKTTFKKSELNENKQINSNISNININNNTNISNNMNNITNTYITNTKRKTDEYKKDLSTYNSRYGGFSYNTKFENNKKDMIYAISYKNINRETRFNNIQNYIKQENKKNQKIKSNQKHKLLIYQQMINSRNLLRAIHKPKISFITKEIKKCDSYYTRYDELYGIRLNVKNNLSFYTKKIIRQDEYIDIEKQMKVRKYKKLKKEVEEEKIPTFSSIDTSSSNSGRKFKAKGKSKSKSKSKSRKKTNKNKSKIKPKNLTKKKKTLVPRYNKLRSISIHSKISGDRSEDRKTLTSRINVNPKMQNIKKKTSDKRILGANLNRKFSMVTKFHDRFVNKKKERDKSGIASSTSLRNLNNFSSPFKNSLLNINKQTENEKAKLSLSGQKDKDKINSELDFKKFLEEQKKKRSNQIRNFIKKQGMNSYNFFYPKEPSPLLGIFKNKCSVYPTLNINKKNSYEENEKRYMLIRNDNMNYSPINRAIKKGNKSYRNEKICLKKINGNKNYDDIKDINEIHFIEKHYGLEKDCPICRNFILKKKEDPDMNYMKSSKYNKLRFLEKHSGILSPNSQTSMTNKNDFPIMSRNRVNSSIKNNYLHENESTQIKKNFNALFDYFLQ